MQCLEYKVKNPKQTNTHPHNKQKKPHTEKQLLSLAAISVVFGFLLIIVQSSLALFSKVNIANRILSSLEKLFDEKFCPTVSDGMSMGLQLSVHHKKQHF